MTLILHGTAAVFVAMTSAALWHLRWVRRLPAMEQLDVHRRGQVGHSLLPVAAIHHLVEPAFVFIPRRPSVNSED